MITANNEIIIPKPSRLKPTYLGDDGTLCLFHDGSGHSRITRPYNTVPVAVKKGDMGLKGGIFFSSFVSGAWSRVDCVLWDGHGE